MDTYHGVCVHKRSVKLLTNDSFWSFGLKMLPSSVIRNYIHILKRVRRHYNAAWTFTVLIDPHILAACMATWLCSILIYVFLRSGFKTFQDTSSHSIQTVEKAKASWRSNCTQVHLSISHGFSIAFRPAIHLSWWRTNSRLIQSQEAARAGHRIERWRTDKNCIQAVPDSLVPAKNFYCRMAVCPESRVRFRGPGQLPIPPQSTYLLLPVRISVQAHDSSAFEDTPKKRSMLHSSRLNHQTPILRASPQVFVIDSHVCIQLKGISESWRVAPFPFSAGSMFDVFLGLISFF